jgi:holo-[acyl-carrier protein] synthase
VILGIGLDVVETAKIQELLSAPDQRFEELVFTAAERGDCAARADKVQALAARFAAKEACFKALGTGWNQGVSFRQVEVRRRESGVPELHLSGRALERSHELGVARLHVTLTHTGGVAAAAVILEG